MDKAITKPTSTKVVCPVCGDFAWRSKRTLRDRIVSLITPVKRYRCIFCHWTGTLPNQK